MSDRDFSLDGAKLVVREELKAGCEGELQSFCSQLLERPEPQLVIDLSEVEYVHSLCVGVLSYAWVEALNREKEIVFVVSQPVADVFERTGLAKVFTCKQSEGGA
jgi:anti-anti-sigma factor